MTYGDYPDLSNVKRVLVVKLRHLGDVLLTTPVFAALKKALPEAQIDAYIYEEAKEVLEGHLAITNLIGYDRKWKKLGFFSRLKKEFQLLWQIRKKKYDLIINLTEGDRGLIAAKVSKAKVCVGFPPKGKLQKRFITHTVKHCPSLRHTVEKNLDALRRIGIFPDEASRDLFFHIDEKTIQSMRQPEPFILMHPSSRWRFKCLPVPKMRELVKRLESQGKNVILTSGPDPIEIAMVMAIAQGTGAKVLAGKTTLKELGALLLSSEMLICVDSVAHHLASALKKPVLAFFGPTSSITWGPWRNPNAKILTKGLSCQPCYQDGCGGSKYSDCLATLSVDQMMEEVILLRDNSFSKKEAPAKSSL